MMSKKTINDIFEEQLGKEAMYDKIILKTRKNKKGLILIPLCMIALLLIVIIIPIQEETIDLNVYAYTSQTTKTKLVDNVKIMLQKFDLSSSINPGYPILFDLNNHFDQIDIQIKNGKILSYSRKTGDVKDLGNHLEIYQSQTLYFQINERTEIKVTGEKENKKIVSKNIRFSIDEDYNYYAFLN